MSTPKSQLAGKRTHPYFAHNIGFGLPAGRFFKVEITPKHGPCIYAKVGGCFFESEARQFAVDAYAKNIKQAGGLDATRVREIDQFEAILTSPAPL